MTAPLKDIDSDTVFNFIEAYWGTSREVAYAELKALITKERLAAQIHLLEELIPLGLAAIGSKESIIREVIDTRLSTLKQQLGDKG